LGFGVLLAERIADRGTLHCKAETLDSRGVAARIPAWHANWIGACAHPQLDHKEIQVKNLRALIPTVLLGSAALTLSTQALAADATFAVPSRTVSLRDLDLGEPGHLPIAYARVQQAALAVCDSTVRAERRLHRRVPAGWRDECVRSAVDEAVRSVGNQRLTAVHGRSSELVAEEK
jgi:UrcA family protein